jgi:DNA-binding transcriptional ArsR family regulator
LSGPRKNKASVEVSSRTLQDELIAIKDRLSAIETIESISNAPVVKQYVEDHLRTDKGREIMRECEEPRTRAHLRSTFGFKSDPALDYHLKPLRDADLLRQQVHDDGTTVFEWSNLFRRLPKSTLKKILGTFK